MKIAIAGYGVEGRTNYQYFSQQYPDAEITIVDEKPHDDTPAAAPTLFGEGVFERLNGFDLIIRTPSLAPSRIKTDGKIWSGTNEFFQKCPAPIIGITGTKGKGTTASFVDSILKASGRTSWLLGNIGLPGLDALSKIGENDIVVYELSSFQLWDLEISPSTAIVTMIEQEHLDVHADFEDYVAAKANIAFHQTSGQQALYLPGDTWSEWIANAASRRDDADQPNAARPYIDEDFIHVADGAFYSGTQRVCSTQSVKIPGAHNLDNACAAIAAVIGVKGVTNESIEQGLANFHGLPHRLHFVRQVDGVDYYDDSIATTPSSAIAALRSFDKPKVIILGGSYKGSDFSILAEEMTRHDVRALLIGDEAARIAAALQSVDFTTFEIVLDVTMQKVVQRARELAQPGSVVLLSPSAASFGLFKNYSDRGQQFVAAVEAL